MDHYEQRLNAAKLETLNDDLKMTCIIYSQKKADIYHDVLPKSKPQKRRSQHLSASTHKQLLTKQLKPANALLSNMVNFYRYTMLTMFIFAIFTGISDFYENPYLCNQISIYIFQCIKIGITLTINQSSNISESQRTEAMMNNWNSGYKNSKNPILPWSTPGRNYPDLSSGSIIHSTSNNIV